MSESKEAILRIPGTVREDTAAYRGRVGRFLDGQTSPVAFRAYRVPMGVYEQRTAGSFMVRVRIGAGLVLPFQLERLAELSKAGGSGILHVTTRQDIQIHEVAIGDTPDVLEELLEVGLSPRGGGGNTVRNVTACPRAGVCPQEQFDVAPHAVAVAEYLLQDRSSFNLPRKYKIVFSGCPRDCAFASVADLGLFAHRRDGVDGFAVYSGGGLGSNPAVAVKVEDFVGAAEVFQVAEAVKRLFDKHGDRANKHRARLRYVLAGKGADEFVRLYRLERGRLKSDGLPYEPPEIRDFASLGAAPEAPEGAVPERLDVLPDKTPGRVTVRLWLRHGVISADDLAEVGRIASRYGHGPVRTTQLQDMLIAGVAYEDLGGVESELAGLGAGVFGGAGPKVVACAGAATCKLGLCLSRGLADAISEKLGKVDVPAGGPATIIRISGCPNSCGHHYISDIGLQGRARRIGGRLMPYYDVLTGARTVEGEARLAEPVGSVPARRIPELLSEALSGGAVERERLERLVAACGQSGQGPAPEDYYYDFGADEPFSLAGRGPGECGAGVMDVISLDISEAKDAIAAAGSESIYKATVAAARALLVTFGLEPGTDREILSAFGERLIEPGWVGRDARQLLDAAIDWRMGDRQSLDDLAPQAERLIARVEELFLSLDASLNFTVAPAARKDDGAAEAEARTHTVDLRGVACPMNFVKAKLALEGIQVGEVLEVLLDDGEPVRNAPASFTEQGQEVIEIAPRGEHFSVKVRRKK